MAPVVVGAPLGQSGAHGKDGVGAIQGLDPGFLIHAQQHVPLRRGHVQTYDVAHLFDEQGIPGQLEGLYPVGLQCEGAPDAGHGALAHAAVARHLARAPVGCIPGRGLYRHDQDPFDLLVGYGTRRSRAWPVQQSVTTLRQKTP